MKPNASAVERRANGLTLVELTIVLALIVTLALVLAPSIVGTLDESRRARAQNDCNRLALAITHFRNDTAPFLQWLQPRPTERRWSERGPVLLVGPGRQPARGTAAGTEAWLSPADSTIATLADQLIENTPRYPRRDPSAATLGWNGPYLSAITADPWNNRYAVNVAFLEGSSGPQEVAGPVKHAVWVLSAGPNGIVETPFSQPARSAVLGGDDIGTRVQ